MRDLHRKNRAVKRDRDMEQSVGINLRKSMQCSALDGLEPERLLGGMRQTTASRHALASSEK